MKHVKLYEDFVNEATTSWKKMMQGVRSSETGPWSIVAIQDRKVVGQSINIRIQDLVPAKYEALKKEFPKAKLHIEDGTGMVVWNEGIERLHAAAGRYNNYKLNEAKFKIGDKWEWHHVSGVKTVEITNVKSNGDVVGREDGSSEDFIVRDANKYLKKKVTESLDENFPGPGETVNAKDLNYSMLDYFARTNKVLSIDTKSKKGIKGSVGKMYGDLVFNGDDINIKDIVRVKIIESTDITHTKDSDTLAGNPGEDDRMLNVRAFRGTVADLTSFINDKIGK